MTEDLPLRLSQDLESAFPDVVAAYQQVVFSIALRLSARPEDAADLAAEAFLRAYTALRAYPAPRIGELQVRPWLVTIVLNLARNEARSAGRRPHLRPLDTGADGAAGGAARTDLADGNEAPDEQVQRHDGQARLGRMLTDLPDAQRTAVVLRHVVGMPYAEVATVMGCPEGTAKSHVARGLRRLRSIVPQEAR